MSATAPSIFGGLCASGWHTLLITYRLYTGLKLFKGTALAGLGSERLRFLAPVYVNDTIRVRVTIAETIATKKSDRGIVRLRLSTYNDADVLVAELLLTVLVKRREASAADAA